MKKLFSVLLAVMLISAFALSVSAGTYTGDGSTLPYEDTGLITVTMSDAAGSLIVTTPPVYKVDVEWSNTTLTYQITSVTNGTAHYEWNPQTHVYTLVKDAEAVVDGEWVGAVTIDVTNHSNEGILATWESLATTNGVTFDADVDSFALAEADTGASLNNPANAPTNTFTITADGVPTQSFDISSKVIISAN